jgi:hypothetical protein
VIPREVERYQAAGLAELGVHPEALAKMTDKQIHLVYRHPREKTGELRAPLLPQPVARDLAPEKKARTLKQSKDDLRRLAKATGMKPAALAEAMAALEAKYRGTGTAG